MWAVGFNSNNNNLLEKHLIWNVSLCFVKSYHWMDSIYSDWLESFGHKKGKKKENTKHIKWVFFGCWMERQSGAENFFLAFVWDKVFRDWEESFYLPINFLSIATEKIDWNWWKKKKQLGNVYLIFCWANRKQIIRLANKRDVNFHFPSSLN